MLKNQLWGERVFQCVLVVGGLFLCLFETQGKEDYPDPMDNPESPLMLQGDWVPEDTHQIDFFGLPKIPHQHTFVSDARPHEGVNQHNYMIHHDGKFWIMWSDGPGIEDRVGQRVKWATSEDGLDWSEPKYLTPIPPKSGPDSPHYNTRTEEGFRYISRGFWLREEKLLALASLDEAGGFFGPSLELRAFQWDAGDKAWKDMGVVYDDTINNFPPKKLPNGQWMMSRRSHDRNVFFLVGGIEGIDKWESYPSVSHDHERLKPEEPYWWLLPDNNILALYRDNNRSGYLFRSFSTDNGRTWNEPVKTNFPDARSKFNGLQLSDGRYVLVSNANPEKRDPLVLSISDDGIVFNKMGYLFGGRRVDYPHVIEHEGHLLVAFSGGKSTVEVVKIKLEDLSVLDGQR